MCGNALMKTMCGNVPLIRPKQNNVWKPYNCCCKGKLMCGNDLFVLRINVPVNFSVMSGWSQRFLGLTSTVGN